MLARVRLGYLHSAGLQCGDLSVTQGLFVSKVLFCILKPPQCPPERAATREMPVTLELSPTSQEAPPRTSPPHPAQMTSMSAPRASPGTEPTRVVNTDRQPELLTGTAPTPGGDTPTVPAWGEELSHPFLPCPVSPSCSLWAHINKRSPSLFSFSTDPFPSSASLREDISGSQRRLERDKQRHHRALTYILLMFVEFFILKQFQTHKKLQI